MASRMLFDRKCTKRCFHYLLLFLAVIDTDASAPSSDVPLHLNMEDMEGDGNNIRSNTMGYSASIFAKDSASREFGVDYGPRGLGNVMGTGSLCGQKRRKENRIAGGEETMVNEYPWMIQVERQGGRYCFTEDCKGEYKNPCGGALISSRWAITAAHCIGFKENIYPASRMRIVLGAHKRQKADEDLELLNIPRIIVNASGIMVHPNFLVKEFKRTYDIALVKLVEPVDLNIYSPVCLPKMGDEFEGKMAWTYGWGYDIEKEKSDVLMELSVPIVSDGVCKADRKMACGDARRYCRGCKCDKESFCKKMCQKCVKTNEECKGTKLFNHQVCAGGEERGKSICGFDSGAPLTVDVNGKHTLVGIVKGGYGGCRKDLLKNVLGETKYYGLFTEVAFPSVSQWIRTTMDKNDGQWGSWGDWGTCQMIGNDCKQIRTRTCTNPEPLDEGKKCTGDAEESRDCQDDDCRQGIRVVTSFETF